MTKPDPKPAPLSPKARAWALAPFVSIALMLAGLGYMARVAANDPSFSVERDYYQKAIGWDQTQAQAGTNARLGWKLELELVPRGSELELVVRAKDAHGAPIPDASVQVEAFANSRASDVVSARLERRGPVELGGRVPLRHAGLWEFRFVVEAGGERFTEVVRRDVTRGPS